MEAKSFKNHAIWELLGQAQQHLAEYDNEFKLSEEYLDAKSKIDYLYWIFDQSDANLIGKQELDQIVQSQLQSIVNLLSQNKPNLAQLVNLAQPFAAIMKTFPYPRLKRIFRSESNEIVEEFRQQFEILGHTVRQEIIDLQKELETNTDDAKQLKAKLDETANSLTQIKSQVSSQLGVWENANKAEIAERLGELNTEFEEAQTRRRKEIEEQIQKISDTLSNIREQASATQTQSDEKMSEASESLASWRTAETEKAEKLLSQIRNIYEVVGQTALAGDFEKAAKEESASAWWFSLGAVIFFVVAPFFFAVQWWSLDMSQYDFLSMLSKIASSAIFLIPAAYFASTAQRHRRVSTALRSLGVRVATFDAYLANFELAERNKLKAKMATVFFNSNISPDRIRNTSGRELNKNMELFSDTLGNIEEVVKTTASTIRQGD